MNYYCAVTGTTLKHLAECKTLFSLVWKLVFIWLGMGHKRSTIGASSLQVNGTDNKFLIDKDKDLTTGALYCQHQFPMLLCLHAFSFYVSGNVCPLKFPAHVFIFMYVLNVTILNYLFLYSRLVAYIPILFCLCLEL